MKYSVDNSDENNPILEILVGGFRYRFSMSCVEPDAIEWLAEVVSKQFKEVHDRAVDSTTKEFQNKLKDLIGVEHG